MLIKQTLTMLHALKLIGMATALAEQRGLPILPPSPSKNASRSCSSASRAPGTTGSSRGSSNSPAFDMRRVSKT